MDHSSPADCGFSSESSFHNEAAEAYDRTSSPGPPYSLSHFPQQGLSPSSSQKDVSSVSSPGTSNENSNQAVIVQLVTPKKQNVSFNAGISSQPANLEDGPAYITSNSIFGFASFRLIYLILVYLIRYCDWCNLGV